MNIKYYYFIDEFNKNEIEKLSSQISLIYRNYDKKNKPQELKKLVIHFKNNKNKKFLDVIKTNLLKKMTKNKIVLLGGINQKTLKKTRLCSPYGIAAISWIKKNGPSINTGPF